MSPRRVFGLALLAAALLGSPAAGAEGERPPVLTREAWGAQPALPGLVPHRIVGIIVHHTGEAQKPGTPFATKLRNLQAFSQRSEALASGRRKPAWPDLPYHFYIDAGGAIAEGRDVRFAGSTNTNYNPAGYVQVVLEGDFEVKRPTAAQLDALRRVLRWQLSAQHLVVAAISVHKDHAATACPGRNLAAAMPGILAALQRESR